MSKKRLRRPSLELIAAIMIHRQKLWESLLDDVAKDVKGAKKRLRLFKSLYLKDGKLIEPKYVSD